MNEVKEIQIEDALHALEEKSTTFVDIRDAGSFEEDHIEGSININDSNVESFVSATQKDQPIVVVCYHGVSSQAAALYFQEQGFTNVKSMVGGFEAWREFFPTT